MKLNKINELEGNLIELPLVQSYLRIQNDAENNVIEHAIQAATAFISGLLECHLKETCFEEEKDLKLGQKDLYLSQRAVQSLQWVMVDGKRVDTERHGQWVTISQEGAVIKARYTVGYTPESLPADIRQGLMMAIEHFYENRSADELTELGDRLRIFLNGYRHYSLGGGA